jgi:hypothetical protein
VTFLFDADRRNTSRLSFVDEVREWGENIKRPPQLRKAVLKLADELRTKAMMNLAPLETEEMEILTTNAMRMPGGVKWIQTVYVEPQIHVPATP